MTRNGRPLLCGTFALALAGCFCCIAPQAAFATYADVTDSYPAIQDVTPSGSAIPASKIPSGTYSITASTSSYMCRITNCTLAVKDGKMAVTFTMSKAYTRIYLGTAEEAAQHTNAAGTDDSAYYKGTPPDGYVSHVYTLPVSELNRTMTIATYAGGTKTRKWFTRTVCFNASAEVNEAVATGKAPEPKKDNGGSGPGSGSGSGSNGGKTDPGKGSGTGVNPRAGKTSGSAGSKKGGAGSAGGASAKKGSSSAAAGAAGTAGSGLGAGAGGGTASGSGGGAAGSSVAGAGGSGAGGSGAKSEKKRDASDGGADKGDAGGSGSKSKAGPRVIGLTPAQAATLTGDELPDASDETQDPDDHTAFNVALGVVAAAIVALAAVLGVTLRRIRKLRPGKKKD